MLWKGMPGKSPVGATAWDMFQLPRFYFHWGRGMQVGPWGNEEPLVFLPPCPRLLTHLITVHLPPLCTSPISTQSRLGAVPTSGHTLVCV